MKINQKLIDKFILDGFIRISKLFPRLVNAAPGSFECGHMMGYKQALLDLDKLLETDK